MSSCTHHQMSLRNPSPSPLPPPPRPAIELNLPRSFRQPAESRGMILFDGAKRWVGGGGRGGGKEGGSPCISHTTYIPLPVSQPRSVEMMKNPFFCCQDGSHSRRAERLEISTFPPVLRGFVVPLFDPRRPQHAPSRQGGGGGVGWQNGRRQRHALLYELPVEDEGSSRARLERSCRCPHPTPSVDALLPKSWRQSWRQAGRGDYSFQSVVVLRGTKPASFSSRHLRFRGLPRCDRPPPATHTHIGAPRRGQYPRQRECAAKISGFKPTHHTHPAPPHSPTHR